MDFKKDEEVWVLLFSRILLPDELFTALDKTASPKSEKPTDDSVVSKSASYIDS